MRAKNWNKLLGVALIIAVLMIPAHVAGSLASTSENVVYLPLVSKPTPLLERLTIAYEKAGDIWLWTANLGPQQLTEFGDLTYPQICISDDGQWVAFERQGELWAVDISGVDKRLLVSASEIEALPISPEWADALGLTLNHFAWVPKSTKEIAFNTNIALDGPGWYRNDDLHIVDLDNSQLQTLFGPGEGGEFYYSSDGSQIALVTSSTLSVAKADGSYRVEALTFPPIPASERYIYPEPVWKPDTTALALAIPFYDGTSSGENNKITTWLVSADGTEANLVSEITNRVYRAHVASDLLHLAYEKHVGPIGDNIAEIHIADIDGTNDMIYHNQAQFGEWAPDTRQFIFFDSLGTQIGDMNSTYQLLVSAERNHTQWVDNAHLFYIVALENGRELRLFNINDLRDGLQVVIGGSYDFAIVNETE